MGSHGMALTDGGIETSLLFHAGFELPCFASFPLLGHGRGRAAIRRYFEPFIDMAQERGLPFVLDTATWRANPDWGAKLGYDDDTLAAANRDAVKLARELATGRSDVTINGLLGPRGDGYAVGERMDADHAAAYHGWQVGILREAGVQRITALTLSYPDEAIGVVRAAASVGVPVVASFTVETDGRLPDGTSVSDAVERVDRATNRHDQLRAPDTYRRGTRGRRRAAANRRSQGERFGAEPCRARRGGDAGRRRPRRARP
jgi:S-methylmethionine-dependent homocysteine/selenocysteine methylase